MNNHEKHKKFVNDVVEKVLPDILSLYQGKTVPPTKTIKTKVKGNLIHKK